MIKYNVNSFVLVKPDRGKTPGIAQVIQSFDNEAEILFDNGEKARYYFAHLYVTMECIKRRETFFRERAEKVGKNKKQSKRK